MRRSQRGSGHRSGTCHGTSFGTSESNSPPLATQLAIARYLDREGARIDALVAAKKQMVELLEERLRTAITSITDVGPHVCIRRLTSLRTSGPRGWGDLVTDAGAPFIRSANLQRDGIELQDDNLAYVTPPRTAESDRSRTSEGDVLVGITGANTGWVGLVGRNLASGYVSQHVAILRPRGVDSRWLAYSIFSDHAQRDLLGEQYGGTKQQLGLDDLAELAIHVPSMGQQLALASQLDSLTGTTNSVVTALKSQVELLQEHRQSLITAAVTGELDVPESA